MSDEPLDPPSIEITKPEPKTRWFEPACAMLMAVASVATAWCSYQSWQWSEQSSALDTHGDKIERQAIAWHLEAQETASIQLRLVMEVIAAQMEGNEKLARFYTDRFPPEIKSAYGKWIALNPFEDPAAPPHPFVPALYTPRFEREIRDASAEAARVEAEASIAGHYAGSYLSSTVILAMVLLFASTAEKFDQRRVRMGSLGFAVALFLFAIARMLMLPVA